MVWRSLSANQNRIQLLDWNVGPLDTIAKIYKEFVCHIFEFTQ